MMSMVGKPVSPMLMQVLFITYSYSDAGDMLTQTDARGKTISNSYDNLGRLLKRSTEEGHKQYEYYNESNNNKDIKRV